MSALFGGNTEVEVTLLSVAAIYQLVEEQVECSTFLSLCGSGDVLHVGHFVGFIYYAAAQCFSSVAYPEKGNLTGKVFVQSGDFFQ